MPRQTSHSLQAAPQKAAPQKAKERDPVAAGARDAAAVRQLGFVPIGGIGAALEMARGHRGPDARIGFLLAPPYFPLRVGSEDA